VVVELNKAMVPKEDVSTNVRGSRQMCGYVRQFAGYPSQFWGSKLISYIKTERLITTPRMIVAMCCGENETESRVTTDIPT